MKESSGCVVDGVAMMLSLVAAEGWRECYFELLPRGIKLCFRAHDCVSVLIK